MAQTYKVVTGRQDVELVEADDVDLDTNSGRLNFYLNDTLVGSFVGYSSFNVLNVPTEGDNA